MSLLSFIRYLHVLGYRYDPVTRVITDAGGQTFAPIRKWGDIHYTATVAWLRTLKGRAP